MVALLFQSYIAVGKSSWFLYDVDDHFNKALNNCGSVRDGYHFIRASRASIPETCTVVYETA